MSGERIVRYTADEMRQMQAKEGPRDWTKFDAMTDDELEALIAGDPDEGAHPDQVWVRVSPKAIEDLEPELLKLLPPAGPGRDDEIWRIVRTHLKRKAAARARRAG